MPRSTQLTNVRHRPTAPTGFTHGDTYFDEATRRLYVAWAGAWVPIGTTPEVNVSTGGPAPRVAELLWVDSDATPTPTGWQLLTLQGAWANYGGGWAPGAWRQVGDEVQLRGLVMGGGAGSVIAQLPVPGGGSLIFDGDDGSGKAVRLDVNTDGRLTYGAAGTSGYTSLSMIRYSVTN